MSVVTATADPEGGACALRSFPQAIRGSSTFKNTRAHTRGRLPTGLVTFSVSLVALMKRWVVMG